jgi:hypothetical protein
VTNQFVLPSKDAIYLGGLQARIELDTFECVGAPLDRVTEEHYGRIERVGGRMLRERERERERARERERQRVCRSAVSERDSLWTYLNPSSSLVSLFKALTLCQFLSDRVLENYQRENKRDRKEWLALLAKRHSEINSSWDKDKVRFMHARRRHWDVIAACVS